MITPPPQPATTTLLVIAKQPLPGRVKTRLVPPCTHEQAAALAEAALADTLHAVAMTPATGAIQRARLMAAGLRVTDFPRLRDVDTAADAVAVARQAPRTRFAARARSLAAVLSPADSLEGAFAAGASWEPSASLKNGALGETA